MEEFTALEWMQIAGLGAVFGVIGQAIRVVPGLKKMNEEAQSAGLAARQMFSGSRMGISLAIGALAGVLAAWGLGIHPADNIKSEVILGLIGAGYAGADFIEGFIKSKLPASGPAVNGAAAQREAGPPVIAAESNPPLIGANPPAGGSMSAVG